MGIRSRLFRGGLVVLLGLWSFRAGGGEPGLYERHRKAAAQGNPTAQLHFGRLYYTGQEVPQDFEEAARWYRRAAGSGLAEAQFQFGLMLEEGRGVPQSDQEAAQWYFRAAEQGHVDARIFLGVMYRHGRGGLPQDPVVALMWFNLAAHLAAQGGQKEARLALLFQESLIKQLNALQISHAKHLVDQYLEAHPVGRPPGIP
ncbi:MAG: sel1 repeat family protein [Magnetococcales bacterium]|nr:sel1 repeat family protein [Magnetococcales bacterium]